MKRAECDPFGRASRETSDVRARAPARAAEML